jgi:hypothetical protein
MGNLTGNPSVLIGFLLVLAGYLFFRYLKTQEFINRSEARTKRILELSEESFLAQKDSNRLLEEIKEVLEKK